MKKQLLLSLLVLGLLLPSVFSSAPPLERYAASYTIIQDKVIVEVALELSSPVSSLEWPLPEDAAAVEVKNQEYRVLVGEGLTKTLLVSGPNFQEVTFKYITSSPLETGRDNFFIVDLAGIDASTISLTVALPEKATLKYPLGSDKTAIVPLTDNVTTDGQIIKVHWDQQDVAQGNAVLIIYTLPAKFSRFWIAAIFIILGAAVVGYYGYYHKSVKKRNATSSASLSPEHGQLQPPETLTKNLFEEEKKIVEILLAEGELWQKQLELKSGLSKVKLFRKLRSLEAKGLIEKIPYGNSNKIRLKS